MLLLRHGLLPFLALALLLSVGLPARAQTETPDPETALDPESQMAPMGDIGVDWPDMAQPTQIIDVSTPTKAQPPETVAENDSALRYSVVIAGLDPTVRAQLSGRFDVLSTLRAGEDKSANAAQISRRARDDAALLDQLLENLGYYDAEVEPLVERQPGDALIVRLTADAGTLYRFANVAVIGLDQTGAKAAVFRDVFGVANNDPVDADAVINGKAALAAQFKRDGLPFAKIAEPQVIVDHESQTATLLLTVDPGGERRIGKFIVIGDRAPFGASHVKRIARFQTGSLFNQGGLDDLKRALIATGLASVVNVSAVPGDDPAVADVAVSLEPAPLRTIAGEFGYGTGEGVRISGSWTNRNLIPPEGAVTLRGVLGTREQLLGAVLRQGNFGKRDQVLNGRIGVSRSDFRAFKASTFEIAAGIERQSNIIWQKKWTWSAGVELLATDERDLVGAQTTRRRTFFIGAAPLTLHYDGTNDLLDATRGFRLGLRVSPELSLQGRAFGYVRTQLDGSVYVPASSRITIAGRARVGTIAGSKSDAIAPSRRFYAGGGGSIRGYGFQQIGPRDILNDPDGGRSLTEFALEARVRFGVFGVVPFVDAGNIYSSALPKLSGLRYGAGIGGRYYSNFGPIRIDVGTPINPQKGDARVTVFVSLGQAF
jgi:translocation and assembly module TamA